MSEQPFYITANKKGLQEFWKRIGKLQQFKLKSDKTVIMYCLCTIKFIYNCHSIVPDSGNDADNSEVKKMQRTSLTRRSHGGRLSEK